MEEIKYRVRFDNRWVSLELGKGLSWNEKIALEECSKQGVKFYQFTGLKDKNGKEIYEGDILRLDGTEEYENCTPKPSTNEYIGVFKVERSIDWWGYSFDWINISGYECSTHIMGNYDEFTFEYPNIEILGNILENPELLNS